MKRICCLSTSLICLVVWIFGIQSVTAKTLYDDYSSTFIDTSKWNQAEFVREVSQGKLVMQVHNSTTEESIRKTSPFTDPSSINTIECDIVVHVATLDSGSDPESFARVDGRFYNAQNSGTERGDIWAGLYIGDRGNGLEAWWGVWETTDDAGDNWDEKGSGSLSVHGLSYNQSYTVKIDYDGTNEFTFTVAGVSSPFTGPVRQAVAYTQYKALETLVFSEGGAGNGYVSASFDNVLTDGSAYDDFSSAPLNQAKWQKQESAREIVNGQVRLVSHSTGDRDTTSLNFSEFSPYTEVSVMINSSSTIEPGDRGVARMDGYFYNDTYGPGQYDGYLGNIWSGIWINYYGDGTLKAACSADRTLDAADTQWENLFYREFNLPIVLDRLFTLSIRFTDSQILFTCQDTVTGRIDLFVYEINTPVFTAYNSFRALRSRVYGDSTSGYMAVHFDDVYVDVAEPPAVYDATGDWEITTANAWADSGCDLPDVDETTGMSVTQNGNDLTMIAHNDDGDDTLTGKVYDESYYFEMTETQGLETNIVYGTFSLSQNALGSGNVVFIWFDDVDYCESGVDITIAKPAPAAGDDSDDNGGSNGGVCFIDLSGH
jgi:hypothetical protein